MRNDEQPLITRADELVRRADEVIAQLDKFVADFAATLRLKDRHA